MFAEKLLAFLGLLRFALGLCVMPEACIDLAQLLMGRCELRIQGDHMLERLSRVRPILF